MIEKTQILQNKNKEQGDRIREINKERIDLLRRTELLEDIIQGLETVYAQEQKRFLAKETITKPAVQREKQEQKVQTIDLDKILEEIHHEIKR